ncbi:MAG: bifunctional copper resistance protein CopD/cytochrome c oxidase assembly protein [Streptosporangiales bacterium]|nr:bifunctional copper resistance protein CopD/cytochrome c oxidase assembly protein [Streptosporangiales bacterium]
MAEQATTRRVGLPWAYLLGVLAAGGLTLVVVLLVGGGAPEPPPPGLPDAGPVVGWALPVSRFLADAAGVLVAGTTLVAAALLPAGEKGALEPAAGRSVRTAAVAAGVSVVATAAELVFTYADFLGIPAGQAVGGPGISSFVVDTVQGRTLLVQILLSGVVVLAAASVRTARGAGWLSLAAFVAVTGPALAGHAASSSDHVLAQTSLVLHLLGVSAWVGGLAGVCLAARVPGAPLRTLATRFSWLALWCVVAVGISGLVNAWLRLGSFGEVAGSSYGLLALGKLFALVLLGTFGWLHRTRTLPRLEDGSRRPFVRLAAVEVAVMAATVGLAVGLSRTPTPYTGQRSTSAAESLLGYPLPPPPTAARLLFDAHVDATWLGILVVCAALYATGTRVLARRGDRWPVGRSVAWYGGLAVVLLMTSGGVGRYAPVLFSVHMVQHMALNMVAPILLVLAAPVTLALRALPARADGGGVRRLLVDVLHSRVVRVLTHPLVATAVFVTGLYLVYFSDVYDFLMEDHWGHFLMQAHFLLSGALFFWVLVGVDPGTRRLPFPFRMGLMLAVMAMHAFFSVALMSYGTVIGAAYYAALDRPWSTDLVADQRLGGGIGWAFGEVPTLLVLAAMFVQWIRADRREAEAYDRMLDRRERAGGDGPARPG